MTLSATRQRPCFYGVYLAPFGTDSDWWWPSPVGGFLTEFWQFLWARKKFWLLPLLLSMGLVGGLILVTEGSAIAPFIYTLY